MLFNILQKRTVKRKSKEDFPTALSPINKILKSALVGRKQYIG
jgi:hypothetical protein